jgi:hypothetical protein
MRQVLMEMRMLFRCKQRIIRGDVMWLNLSTFRTIDRAFISFAFTLVP